MYANLRYQPQVSTKFQLNRSANSWEIPICVRYNDNNNNNRLQTVNESPEAGKTIVRCNLSYEDQPKDR
jgi:hypothetical protein